MGGKRDDGDGGFSAGWITEDELIYKRTFNELSELLRRMERDLAIDTDLGILTDEEIAFEEKLIKMMRETAKNTYIAS